MPSPRALSASGAQYVWYSSYGSNMLYARFLCYLRGGRVDGMVKDMPGSRDPTPPERWTQWDDIPYRLFFAHSSPTWDGGGVAFVDVDAPVTREQAADAFGRRRGAALADDPRGASDPPGAVGASLGTAFRLYRVTLEQFNDVLAQENGMLPGDARCRELTPCEATALAEHWIDLAAAAPSSRATTTLLLPRAGSECAALDPRWSGPPAQTRVSSERWYGHVKCIGAHEGEPVLTFTCDGAQLRDFRDGAVPANAPSEAYADVIRRGLVEMGASPEEARRYVEARTNAPLVREKESTA